MLNSIILQSNSESREDSSRSREDSYTASFRCSITMNHYPGKILQIYEGLLAIYYLGGFEGSACFQRNFSKFIEPIEKAPSEDIQKDRNLFIVQILTMIQS